MSIITVPFSKPWQVKLPVFVRYLESKWIDRFFDTGELMLSSFSQFRKHKDEQRRDHYEGASVLDMKFGGQPLSGVAYFGDDAYVLSGSMIESNDLMQKLGYDGFFRINDTVRFASAVANVIPSFIFGFEGACIYRDERTVRRGIDGPPLFIPPAEERETETLFSGVERRVFEATALEPFFFKSLEYADQGEYRLVWCVSSIREDRLLVKCPDARKFCERPQ